MQSSQPPLTSLSHKTYDCCVVGAGFGGLAMTNELKKLGKSQLICVEKGGDVGGTWYYNSYPGAACDVESYWYSYDSRMDAQLQQEWHWTRRYPTQPEIFAYAQFVARKCDLYPLIRFHTIVTAAQWNEATGLWTITLQDYDNGNNKDNNNNHNVTTIKAKYFILATGPLSSPQTPKVAGIDTFAGQSYHTHAWPQHADLRGLRVGVVGTGSTATQVIPAVQPIAKHLYVFQRSAAYCAPRLDRPTDPEFERKLKKNYDRMRVGWMLSTGSATGGNAGLASLAAQDSPSAKTTKKEYDDDDELVQVGGGFTLSFVNHASQSGGLSATKNAWNDLEVNEKFAEKLRARCRIQVKNKNLWEALMPHYPVICKRLCITDDYWPTFDKPNVTLVDTKGKGIDRVTPEGIVANGQLIKLDCIIYATGFQAFNGVPGIHIVGKDGITMKKRWENGPRSTFGVHCHYFPNLMIMTGAQSISVLTNFISAIQDHVELITKVIRHMDENKLDVVETTLDAEDEWVDHCNKLGDRSVFSKCDSWYRAVRKDELEMAGSNDAGKKKKNSILPYVGNSAIYNSDVEERGFAALSFTRKPAAASAKL